MKKTFVFLACFILSFNILYGKDNPPRTILLELSDYSVIPLPQDINAIADEQFKLKKDTEIVYPAGDNILKRTAEFLKAYIKICTGHDLTVTDKNITYNAIILKADYKTDKAESYNLNINSERILINGADPAGVFYGVQTLRKTISDKEGNDVIIFPGVDIKDYPRFSHRGMMLDVARHFHTVEFVKKYIDILALHNVNRFHWHLSDDQGWRIEIKKYPGLTEIASCREQTVIKKNTGEYDGKPHCGFFTQDQIKEVIDYAGKQFITVIPEIDLPGHMLAALTAYPELGCTGGPYKVAQTWGVFDEVLCAGNEEVYTFLEDVLSEVADLFPSELIHIGGDECPKVNWEKCPKCQDMIKKQGIKSDAEHTKEQYLQSYLTTRIAEFLESKGKRIIGWDEILEGEIPQSAVIMSWRGLETGFDAAKRHHDVIIAPTSHVYFDYYQSRDIENEPFGIGGYVPVEKVYQLEPLPQGLNEAEQKHILGTQANVWSEYLRDSKHIEYMVMPRIAALSEVQWTLPDKKNYEGFLKRLTNLVKIYQLSDFNYAKHVVE